MCLIFILTVKSMNRFDNLGVPLTQKPFSYDEVLAIVKNRSELVRKRQAKYGTLTPYSYSWLKLTQPHKIKEYRDLVDKRNVITSFITI